MTTIPDHLIDKAARAVQKERAYRAAAAFGVPEDAHTSCAAMIARAVLEAVADDLRAEGALTIRDALLSSLDIPTGPVQTGAMNATAGWASWITDRFNLPTPEETDR